MSDDTPNKIVPFDASRATPPDIPCTGPAPDLFDQIIGQLLADTALVTAPGAIDARWPLLIAQAYRDGLAAFVGQTPHGILFRLESGGLAMYALSVPALAAADVPAGPEGPQ